MPCTDDNISVGKPSYDIKKNVQPGSTQKQNIYGIRIRVTEKEPDCKEQSVNPADYDRERGDMSVVRHVLVADGLCLAYLFPRYAVEPANVFFVSILLCAVEIRRVFSANADVT